MKGKEITRRDFIKTGTLAATAALIMNKPVLNFAAENGKSRVVLIRDLNVLGEKRKIKQEVLQKMFDNALTKLLDVNSAAEGWKKILKPSDVAGIKTNVWPYLRTPLELERILMHGAIAAGIKTENISIDDQGVLGNEVFLRSTALINTRPLRTHYWAGVGSLIKNYVMFVDNPMEYHPDSCADLGKIWKMPLTEGKTRLNVLVMLTPQFHSLGPHSYSSQHTWEYCGLILGLDPVACDTVGVKIFEAKRTQFFGGHKPLTPPAKHIEIADKKYHIGTSDLNKIELIKLGTEEGVLI